MRIDLRVIPAPAVICCCGLPTSLRAITNLTELPFSRVCRRGPNHSVATVNSSGFVTDLLSAVTKFVGAVINLKQTTSREFLRC
jgi:hypothetical protein